MHFHFVVNFPREYKEPCFALAHKKIVTICSVVWISPFYFNCRWNLTQYDCSNLSLQQWFEYCPNGKKRNCPVCKQTCTEAKVGRLYFQSINDPGDSSLSQKPHDYEENSEELRTEVKRLEGKVVGLGSALEVQQKEFKEVIDQVFPILLNSLCLLIYLEI